MDRDDFFDHDPEHCFSEMSLSGLVMPQGTRGTVATYRSLQLPSTIQASSTHQNQYLRILYRYCSGCKIHLDANCGLGDSRFDYET